jgi:hypothetical protein
VPRHDDIEARSTARRWVRPEDYVEALARRRTARLAREGGPQRRTQPEAPRFSLSTLPFVALFTGLAVLTIAIFLIALPGSAPRAERQPEPKAVGTAAKGWFQEAEREFKKSS